jgi:hypothetical protein
MDDVPALAEWGAVRRLYTRRAAVLGQPSGLGPHCSLPRSNFFSERAGERGDGRRACPG